MDNGALQYQNSITRHKETPDRLSLQAFRGFQFLLPLNGGRGLGGNIVDHPVDTVHLINNTVGYPLQHIVR